MWVFVAEALGALGLLLFIVWWTLGPTQRREQEAMRALARDRVDQRTAPADEAAIGEPATPPTGDPRD